MSYVSGGGGGSSGGLTSAIKSMQTGTIAITTGSVATNTATITAVSTSKAVVIFNGFTNNDSATPATTTASYQQAAPSVALTNGTTVTGNVNATGAKTMTLLLSFTVIEYN